jgi:hypothetical protein
MQGHMCHKGSSSRSNISSCTSASSSGALGSPFVVVLAAYDALFMSCMRELVVSGYFVEAVAGFWRALQHAGGSISSSSTWGLMSVCCTLLGCTTPLLTEHGVVTWKAVGDSALGHVSLRFGIVSGGFLVEFCKAQEASCLHWRRCCWCQGSEGFNAVEREPCLVTDCCRRPSGTSLVDDCPGFVATLGLC